ncbi:hypothetical protein B484DRAFT_410250, partial [Ochromonadaceae sp. CCMP2298]
MACSKKQAEDYLDVLVPTIQQALCDRAPSVSAGAARAFLTLLKTVGPRAIDRVVPALLKSYGDGRGEEAALALQGLREIVQRRPRDLLDYLLPSLMKAPVTVTDAGALGAVMGVAGPQLHHYLGSLVPQLVVELGNTSKRVAALREAEGEGGQGGQGGASLDLECVRFDAIKDAAAAVMGAVSTEGVHGLINELGRQMESDVSADRRRWGCWLAEQ